MPFQNSFCCVSLPHVNEQLLTIHEVASLLRMSPAAVRQMRYKLDAPPAIKLGGRLRWRRSDVDAWLEHLAEAQAAGSETRRVAAR
ncbi:MAG: helix-turn-helix domain-containing protein [Ilumatobacteraceae bacterium]